jgi:hypothetical protein
MFRKINQGWSYSGFGEFAKLIHQRNTDKSVHNFIEYSGSPIPWELCAQAEPVLRQIVAEPIFKQTGHQETAIALCDAMRLSAHNKKDLEV